MHSKMLQSKRLINLNQLLSTFHSSVRCITAALKRTPIKDVERELKSVRSPKSKKVKRELRFDSRDKCDVHDDDDNDNEDAYDSNNDAYSLSTKGEEKQQYEAIEFHNGDCRVPIFARGKNVMSPLETVKNKAQKVFCSLGASVREQAGLGRPPARFTTNPSEGNNKVVQDFIHQDTKKTRVSEFEFVQSLQKLIQRQENDLEMAIIDQGPYRVRSVFNHIITSPDDWVKMTPNQRKRALQKVHGTKISEASDGSLTQRPQAAEGAKNPILNRLLQEGIDWIPLSTLTGMTEKAEKILQVPDQVIPIPNSEGSLLIPSKTNARNPHVVSAYSTGRIVCNCVHNKSLSICSHSIVYAEHQKVQPKFYNWLKKLRRSQGSNAINFSNLVSADMPRGRGRKGERPPRTAKATVTHTNTGINMSVSTSRQQQQQQQQQQETQAWQQPYEIWSKQRTQVNQETRSSYSQLQIQSDQQPHALRTQQQDGGLQQLAGGSHQQDMAIQQHVAGALQVSAGPHQQEAGPHRRAKALHQQEEVPKQQVAGPVQLAVASQQQVAVQHQHAVASQPHVAGQHQHTVASQYQIAGHHQHAVASQYQIAGHHQHAVASQYQVAGQHQQPATPQHQVAVLHLGGGPPHQRAALPQPYHNRNPFLLEFRHGNIRKCTGCGGEISKQAAAPDNMILKHMERYQFPTGSPLQPFMYTISKEKAHYYHARTACVIGRHPYFTSNLVDLSKVASELSEGHKLRLVMDLDIFLP